MILTHKIVQPFINVLEETLPYKVTITDTNGYIIGSSDPDRVNMFHPSAYEIICGRKPIESWNPETDSYENVPEGVLLGYGEKIIYDGECIGLIGLVGPPEEMKQSLKTAQMVLHLMLEKKRADDELKLLDRDKRSFLLRLLQGRYGSREWMNERANLYHIVLSAPRFVLTLQADYMACEDSSPLILSQLRQKMNRAARRVFAEDMVYEFDTGEIVVLAVTNNRQPAPQRRRQVDRAIERLYEELKQRYDIPILVGVGEECADYTGIPLSLKQARTAAEIGAKTKKNDGIYHYTNMRLGRIVAGFTPEIRSILQKEILDKLSENKDDRLLETLRIYFEMNENVAETANRLFIHRNTLQYRFARIKEITGHDIRDVDDLVQLRLAVLQHRYFQGKEE